MLGERLLERALARPDAERLLNALAAQVAERGKTPYAAVRELMGETRWRTGCTRSE